MDVCSKAHFLKQPLLDFTLYRGGADHSQGTVTTCITLVNLVSLKLFDLFVTYVINGVDSNWLSNQYLV